MVPDSRHRASVGSLFLACAWLAAACSTASDAPEAIQAGQTRDQVRAAAGEPDEIVEFTLPDGPFFGPQEGLVNLVPSGSPIEEWQYRSGDEISYVWFAGPAGEPPEKWTVIDIAVLPADAVY